MKRILLPVIAVAALAACDKQDNGDTVQCGGFTVEMSFSDDGERLSAVINGDAVELVRAVSASGAKYDGVLNDTAVTMWGKGREWTMILNDDETISCTVK